jgi:hypothetical protein
LKQNEEKSEEFLRGLKERARRMPDAELAKEVLPSSQYYLTS